MAKVARSNHGAGVLRTHIECTHANYGTSGVWYFQCCLGPGQCPEGGAFGHKALERPGSQTSGGLVRQKKTNVELSHLHMAAALALAMLPVCLLSTGASTSTANEALEVKAPPLATCRATFCATDGLQLPRDQIRTWLGASKTWRGGCRGQWDGSEVAAH